MLIGYLLWRSHRYNRILASKNRKLFAEIEHNRLEHVARLLKTTDKPIAIIGEISGIPSRATLARLFRIAYGMTPSEYRNTTPKN